MEEVEQELVERNARVAELEEAGHAHGKPLKIRRLPPVMASAVFSTLVAIPGIALLVLGDHSLAPWFLAGGALVIALTWLIALASLAGPILSMNAISIELPGDSIPWTDVANIGVEYGLRPIEKISQRIPPRNRLWMRGDRTVLILDVVSRHDRRGGTREVRVLIERPSETPAVILELARKLWERAAGDAAFRRR